MRQLLPGDRDLGVTSLYTGDETTGLNDMSLESPWSSCECTEVTTSFSETGGELGKEIEAPER